MSVEKMVVVRQDWRQWLGAGDAAAQSFSVWFRASPRTDVTPDPLQRPMCGV